MKKILFGVAALGLLGLAGAGIGLKAQDTVEAKAATVDLADGYYLCGTFVDWTHAASKKMTLESENVYVYDGIYLDGHEDYTFQVFSVSNKEESWDYACTTTPSVPDGMFKYWWASGNNAGLKFEDGIRTIKVSVNVSTKEYSFSWSTPFLKIGDTTERMESYKSDSGEYYHTIENVNADDEIQITTADGTILNNYKDEIGNNAYDDSGTERIIAGGDVTVYYNRTTTSTWVGGYSNNLNTFVNGLLADTILDSTCANPVSIAKEETNVWAYYQDSFAALAEFEKDAFQDAVNIANGRGGINASIGNKLIEAAGRYIHLVSKYSLDPFSGVTIAASNRISFQNADKDTSNNVVTISVIVSAAVLLSIGLAAVARRKHDSK